VIALAFLPSALLIICRRRREAAQGRMHARGMILG